MTMLKTDNSLILHDEQVWPSFKLSSDQNTTPFKLFDLSNRPNMLMGLAKDSNAPLFVPEDHSSL